MKKYDGKCQLCGVEYSRVSRGRPPVFCEACSKLTQYQRAKMENSAQDTQSTTQKPHATQPAKKRIVKLLGSNSTGYVIPIRKEKEAPVQTKEPEEHVCLVCGMPLIGDMHTCPYCQAAKTHAKDIFDAQSFVATFFARTRKSKPVEHWCDAPAIQIDIPDTFPVFIRLAGSDIILRRAGKDTILHQWTRTMKAEAEHQQLLENLTIVLYSFLKRGCSIKQSWVSVQHTTAKGGSVASDEDAVPLDTDIAVDALGAGAITPKVAGTPRRYVHSQEDTA